MFNHGHDILQSHLDKEAHVKETASLDVVLNGMHCIIVIMSDLGPIFEGQNHMGNIQIMSTCSCSTHNIKLNMVIEWGELFALYLLAIVTANTT